MLEEFIQMFGGADVAAASASPKTPSSMMFLGIAICIFVIVVIAGGVAGVLSVQKASVDNQK